MDTTDPPAEALITNHDERTTLVSFLDLQRRQFARKCSGLTDAQLNQRLAPSSLTLGGLMKHLAFVEDFWFTERFAGLAAPEPWASAPWDDDWDWDYHSAADSAAAELTQLWDASCARSRAIVDATDSLDVQSKNPNARGEHPNLRWVLVHLIEEYARHLGHADLIRESIDGQVGD